MYGYSSLKQRNQVLLTFSLLNILRIHKPPVLSPCQNLCIIHGLKWPVLLTILEERPNLKLLHILHDISVNYCPILKI